MSLTHDIVNIEDDEYVLVRSKEEIEAERAALAQFALGANLAHNLAYQNNAPLSKIKIKEEDKVEREYQVLPIHSGHNAINAEMYVPTGENIESTIYVNFTGTNSLATAHADLEHNAGEQTFHRKKKHIMAQIADAVNQVHARTGKPVKLHFSGHSLGGALAQHAMNEALRYFGANLCDETEDDELRQLIEMTDEQLVTEIEKHNTHPEVNNDFSKEALEQFKKVRAIKLSIWNASGVSSEVETHSNVLSNVLVKNGFLISFRNGMIGGDFVQKTGLGTVLSNSDADVEVLKLDLGHEGFRSNLLKSFLTGSACVAAGLTLGPVAAGVLGTIGLLTRAGLPTLRAHTSPMHCFNNEQELRNISNNEDIPYEKLTNATPEGRARIEKRLKNKSTVLQSAPMMAGKSVLHAIGTGCSRTKNAIKNVFNPTRWGFGF